MLLLRAVFLHELVEREAQGFRDTEQIRFRLRVPATIKVFVDETELGRVLLNLFENARRYGHHPGEPALVEVGATRQHAWVELRVRDHGPGVPPDRLTRLTTPFYRGDAARTAASGAGLGLAIVEKSIQRMGGELSISNAEGGGLITVVRLQPA
jgi:two-component system osmolarity sensor histidine kinase EnvZ